MREQVQEFNSIFHLPLPVPLGRPRVIGLDRDSIQGSIPQLSVRPNVRRLHRSGTVDWSAPVGRPVFGVGLIFLSFILSPAGKSHRAENRRSFHLPHLHSTPR
jgi:hypothetical protein